jgi:hypothetical protein
MEASAVIDIAFGTPVNDADRRAEYRWVLNRRNIEKNRF